MTTAVASKVSQADNDNHDVNDQLLGRDPGIQTLGATAFDQLLASIEIIVACARQTGECIGLLGVTFEDITLDSPGDTDPSAGYDEQGAAAVVVAGDPLRGDAWMTATGSPWSKGSNWMAGIGSSVGEPLKTRCPGYSLPPLPSFHNSLANIDGAVRRYSRQTNDNWEWTAHFGTPMSYEAIGCPGMMYLQEAIIETLHWTDERQYGHPENAQRWMTINLWLLRHTRSYVEIYSI